MEVVGVPSAVHRILPCPIAGGFPGYLCHKKLHGIALPKLRDDEELHTSFAWGLERGGS